MQEYVAFLRGINVGGKGLIKMADLKDCLTIHGLQKVTTYIQSGNVLFSSENTNKQDLAKIISDAILHTFDLSVSVAVFTKQEWKAVIEHAPQWWGEDTSWKHNILIMIESLDIQKIIVQIGTLESELESLEEGYGVIYQSVSWEGFSRATSGKLASMPIYKKMTVRNYNTATKLASLLDNL